MRLLIAGIALFSSQIFAATCPDLTSVTKTCRSTTGQTSGNTNQVVTQQTVNGVTTYTMTYTNESQNSMTDTFVADGQTRTVTEVDQTSGMSITTATTISCSGNAVLGHFALNIDGQFLGTMDMTMTKSGGTLTNVVEGSIFGQEIQDTVICE